MISFQSLRYALRDFIGWFRQLWMEKITLPDGEVVKRYFKNGEEIYVLQSGKYISKRLYEVSNEIANVMVKNLNTQAMND